MDFVPISGNFDPKALDTLLSTFDIKLRAEYWNSLKLGDGKWDNEKLMEYWNTVLSREENIQSHTFSNFNGHPTLEIRSSDIVDGPKKLFRRKITRRVAVDDGLIGMRCVAVFADASTSMDEKFINDVCMPFFNSLVVN